VGPSDSIKTDRSARVAGRVQRGLERFYRLERVAHVGQFLRAAPDTGGREAVRLRHAEDGALEIEVIAPPLGSVPDMDTFCQLIEGVSHFVYVAERARRELPATELELELQAEVDKYLLLVWQNAEFDPATSRAIHVRLFEEVSFCHAEGTVEGDRYRLANDLAARFVRRLDTLYAAKGRFVELREALARFYRMGQAEKIGTALAA
jgi:hypothetical protein